MGRLDSPPCSIRPATTGDAEAILAMADRLREGVASWRHAGAVADAVRGWVEGSLAAMGNAGHWVLVADDAGRVVGFVTLAPGRHWSGEPEAAIGELVVSPEAEGRGIGRALVESAMKRAAEDGHVRITVSTGAANVRARRLYERIGFENEDVTLSRGL
jgi:ribosomal protein S18 acetylase RimI-like enzyme